VTARSLLLLGCGPEYRPLSKANNNGKAVDTEKHRHGGVTSSYRIQNSQNDKPTPVSQLGFTYHTPYIQIQYPRTKFELSMNERVQHFPHFSRYYWSQTISIGNEVQLLKVPSVFTATIITHTIV